MWHVMFMWARVVVRACLEDVFSVVMFDVFDVFRLRDEDGHEGQGTLRDHDEPEPTDAHTDATIVTNRTPLKVRASSTITINGNARKSNPKTSMTRLHGRDEHDAIESQGKLRDRSGQELKEKVTPEARQKTGHP